MNISDLENVLIRVDFYKNGFVPRDILKVLAQEQVRKNLHPSLEDAMIESLVDSCLMSLIEQVTKQDFAKERERRENLGSIPIPQYNTKKFVSSVVDLIADLDYERFIKCNN